MSSHCVTYYHRGDQIWAEIWGSGGQQIEDYGCKKKTLSHIRPVAQNSCLRRQIVLLHEIALQQPERLRESVCEEMTPLLSSTVCLKLSDVRLIEPNRDNQNPLDAVKLGELAGGINICDIRGAIPRQVVLCEVEGWSWKTSCDASQEKGDQVGDGAG